MHEVYKQGTGRAAGCRGPRPQLRRPHPSPACQTCEKQQAQRPRHLTFGVGTRLRDMLLRDRIDYLIESQGALARISERNTAKDEFLALRIGGANQPLPLGIACPRTACGWRQHGPSIGYWARQPAHSNCVRPRRAGSAATPSSNGGRRSSSSTRGAANRSTRIDPQAQPWASRSLASASATSMPSTPADMMPPA